MNLTDKIVVVAGASKNTGRVIALAAADAGANLVVAARSASAIQAVAGEIEARGRQALAVTADMADAQQARAIITSAVERFGRVDALIYNAAYMHQRAFLKIDEAHWDQMLDTNLKGYFVTAQAAAQAMVDARIGGSIVGIASTAGVVGFPNNADYCASKGGMVTLTKAMAMDLSRYGIRANCIASGFINGESVAEAEQAGGGAVLQALRDFLPSRRFAEQSEIASAALFLASNASSYCNGSVLSVDGGLTLGNLPSGR
ncbi:SDR family NAD(P)-dependent oxidoreductase [Sphingobium sp. HBC34]|uniref:SDR family NAD(P)-dependent oxidoreductase n=1 Tax=Sphingobium cyanobacteriorum TaxID=3063954 RepID=A0ABT8ZM42_9SPHN|nr:SDR family NAD(P)-dependent oxidoreductase [Sphingobium sp. HBC34]MDO7835609.1 SDR family NAD(P)-dependent oxidoreductase [Sphingobium sp. HBC34]